MKHILVLLVAVAACHAVPIESKADPDYRLIETVTPSTYNVELTLAKDWEKNEKFTGKVTIKLNSTKNEEKIVLHSSTKTLITKATLDGNDVLSKKSFDEVTEKLTIQTPLTENTEHTLEFEYEGKLYSDMYGFYISKYKDSANKEHIIATTQFQATYARRAFPCFDEPAFKAKFTITLNYPKEFKSLGNQPGERTEKDDVATTKFKETQTMSTYLVAFIVHDFEPKKETGENDHEYNVWAPSHLIETAEYAASVSPKIIEELNNFTSIDYWAQTMDQLDQVAIPDFAAGAMENWGLVTYRETALLWDPNESTYRNKQRVASVIAHEFAHMWFGNLVTMKWWESTWLNEGFARYFEYHATAEVEKGFEMKKQFVVEQQQTIFTSDSNTKSLALTSDANSPSQVSAKFGSVTYSKGGSIVRMMEHVCGLDEFKTILTEYLNENAGSNTTPDILFSYFPKVEEKDFKTIMDTWIKVSGFPVVNVKLNDDKKVEISQERFLYDRNEEDTTKWNIPITFTTKADKDFASTKPKTWLYDNQENAILDVNLGSNWIILNIQESAYYRVNYDDELWDRLAIALYNKEIEDINRAQIVDDVMNLARAELMDYIQAFDLISFLENEVEYYPWYSAFESFNFLRKRLNTDERDLLGKFMTEIMAKLHSSVSFDIKDDMGQIEMFKTTLALKWACELGNEQCITKSKELFKNMDEKAINPNLRSIVYCAALRNGTKEDWDKLWTKFTKTQHNGEQVTILGALGCTKDVTILKDYLERSLNNDLIRKQDAYSAFTAVLTGNPEGVAVAFKFLTEKFDKIPESYGSMNALSNVINSVADRLTTVDQLMDFTEFLITEKENLQDAASVADSAIKTARSNLQWVIDNSGELREFFILYFNAPTTTDDSAGVYGSMILLIVAIIGNLMFQ